MVEKTLEKLTTGFFRPPHIWGDRDFFGHGPKVSIEVKLKIDGESRVIAECAMDARETTGDRTRAKGRHESTIYVAPSGVKIKELLSDSRSWLSYIDTDHEEDILVSRVGSMDEVDIRSFHRNTTDCVTFLRTVGDTNGDEAGRRTGFEAFLNPVRIGIEGAAHWQDYSTYIDEVKEGFNHPGNNGCSGAAGAALLNAYGINVSPTNLHDQIRNRGNIIAKVSGAAPAGVFRDALKRYVPDIILAEGQTSAYYHVRNLVRNGYPVIILQGWGSKRVRDYYAPRWDRLGMNMGTDGLHWIVLNGIDFRSRTFSAIDNGRKKRLPFSYVYNTLHFNKEGGFVDWIYGAVGVHNRTYMYVPKKP